MLLAILWGSVPGPGVAHRDMREVSLFYEWPCKYRKISLSLGNKWTAFEFQVFQRVLYTNTVCRKLPAPANFVGWYDLYKSFQESLVEGTVSASALPDNASRGNLGHQQTFLLLSNVSTYMGWTWMTWGSVFPRISDLQ